MRRAVNVDAGGGHSCALQDDGIAVCWEIHALKAKA
ncbi:MAG: hypothetical protein IPN47_16135 [Gemmatimonadetes bacterium]|nr:hypothetical protein [Gemmatimonadota bacterium]